MAGAGQRASVLMGELAAVVGFGVAHPVLDRFGRAPDVFLFEGVSRWGIVLFGLTFTVVPLVGLWALELAVGRVHAGARRVLHVGLLAAAGWVVGVGATSSWAVAGATAVAVVAAYTASDLFRHFLRVSAVGLPAFLILFLFTSPAADLLLAEPATEAGDPRTPLPIVVLVLDELPLASLVDSEGSIDPELYPGFARLADASTWYRNATAVSDATWYSVPSLLSGRLPTATAQPLVRDWPRNLFTMLGAGYEYHVQEAITGLCPGSRCGRPDGGGLTAVLERAWDLYLDVVDPASPDLDPQATFSEAPDPDVDLDAFEHFQPGRYSTFLDGLTRADRPALHYLHLLLPHSPWRLLPSGRTYAHPATPPGQVDGVWLDQPDWPAEQARQRHLLQVQYVDTLVSDLLDRMEETGLLDEAVLVVTSDHGIAFQPGQPVKGNTMEAVAESIIPEMAWVPLFVRWPGGGPGLVDDRNALLTDVVPTIADLVGIPVAAEDDGRSLLGPPRSTADKPWVHAYDNGFFGQDVAPAVSVPASRREEVVRRAAGVRPEGAASELWPYAIGPRADLVGASVDELQIGEASEVTADVDGGGGDVFVAGTLSEDPGPEWSVAIALNGRIGAVSAVFTDGDGRPAFVGMAPEAWLGTGANDVRLYLVPLAPEGRVARAVERS